MDFEYLENDPSTWRYHEPPAYPKWFQEELIRIAGLNRHGKPNLRLVWGGTAISEKNEGHTLKYLAGYSPDQLQGYEYYKDGEWVFVKNLEDAEEGALVTPVTKTEPLGLLRWVIEKWVAPETLEQMQRFRNRYLPGEIVPVLREFPREGVYDCYLIVENKQGRFRNVDKDVLEAIQMMRKYEEKPLHEREADDLAYEDALEKQKEKDEEELWRAVWNFDLRLDKEEKERRAEYWAKHNYASDTRGTFI